MDRTKDVPENREDYGDCVGCGKAIQIGQVLTVWDDEIGHADCAKPFDTNHKHPRDADWPEPVVLLGDPALYVPLAVTKLPHKLPCDVFLPPATMLGKGCDIGVLAVGMSVEGRPAGKEFKLSRREQSATHPLTAEIADLRAQLADEKRRYDQLFDWFNDRDPDAMAEYLHDETAKEFAARRPA